MRTIAAFGRVYKSGPPLNPLLGRDLRRKNTRRFRFDGSANDKSSALACRRSCRDAARHADITKRNYAAGGAPQGETPDLDRTFAARGFGLQHGQHLGVEFMRRLGLGQVGEEIEIVDDTEFDDLFGSAVVGNQIAAESREMGMVLQIDMHLLTRMGCEQNGQHKGREALFEAEVHCLHGGEDTKKRDRDKRPLQKYLQMRVYVLSGTPRGKRTPPEKAGRFKC